MGRVDPGDVFPCPEYKLLPAVGQDVRTFERHAFEIINEVVAVHFSLLIACSFIK
jgi:hypothetical protein